MATGKDHFGVVKRPKHLDPPGYLSKSAPIPEPDAVQPAEPPQGEPECLDPTRYGVWEKKGIAVDF